MKFATARNVTLARIGFGTWKIGGGSSPNPKADPVSMAALRSALEIGYTHFDTAEMYAEGHSEELLGRALAESKTPRDSVFITSKVLPAHLNYDQVLSACENSLRRLKMEYLDLYLIHWPQAGMKLDDTFRALNKLVRDGKTRHLGVSNFNLKLLKEARKYSETPILTNQVPYSLSDRTYVNNGVLEYCQENDVLFTAYSPVEQGSLRTTPALEAIAKAHHASPHQIALAWVISKPSVITIPMSANPAHIAENFQAAGIELDQDEIKQLDG
ncbi:MAG: aldo/keto reductase [Chloroflexi bacterium]|nr:aldo/keto reductase [Chloroflexota bacterium]